MAEQMTSTMEDMEDEDDRETAEFEATIGRPIIKLLSSEMYNVWFMVFSSARNEAAKLRQKVAGSLDDLNGH